MKTAVRFFTTRNEWAFGTECQANFIMSDRTIPQQLMSEF